MYFDAFYIDVYEIMVVWFVKFIEFGGGVDVFDYWDEVELDCDGEWLVVGVSWYDVDVYC